LTIYTSSIFLRKQLDYFANYEGLELNMNSILEDNLTSI
jgi:hypothetical protein